MKNKSFFVLAVLILAIGCSNPNKEYIEKIKQKVKKDADGVELNYKNIEFQWVDTLFVAEELSKLNTEYNEGIQTILNIDYYVQDGFGEGKIFTKSFLTKEKFEKLRNWEREHRNESRRRSAEVLNEKFQDYYEFAFENRDGSEWLSNLCNQIEETDSLLSKYDEINEGDLVFIGNALWYYKRIDDFYSNHNPNPIWAKISTQLEFLKDLKQQIEGKQALNPSQVIYFKALNVYKINNPFLNGAEQELSKYFLFDDKLNIIGTEEVDE